MAQVLLPGRGKDQLTSIAQALNIASSVYGLRTQSKQFEALQAQMAQRESEVAQGIDPASLKGREMALKEKQFESQQAEAKLPFSETKAGKDFIAKKQIEADISSQKLAAKDAKGQKLSQASIKLIQEGNSLPNILSDLDQKLDQNKALFGPVIGRVGAANPYNTQAQVFDADIRAKSQAFGRYMEGGVLRKEDEEKYRKMFPQLSDTPEVARGKLAVVNDLLNKKQQTLIQAYKDQGFDLSGLNLPPTQLAQSPKQGGGIISEANAGQPNISLEKASDAELDKMIFNIIGVK